MTSGRKGLKEIGKRLVQRGGDAWMRVKDAGKDEVEWQEGNRCFLGVKLEWKQNHYKERGRREENVSRAKDITNMKEETRVMSRKIWGGIQGMREQEKGNVEVTGRKGGWRHGREYAI